MITKKELKDYFDKFNKELFNGRLYEPKQLTFSKQLTAAAGNCAMPKGNMLKDTLETPKRFKIKLSTHYHEKYPEEILPTLIHEMIHAKGIMNHGIEFKKEMDRINTLLKEKGYNFNVRQNSKERAISYRYQCQECGKIITGPKNLQNKKPLHRCEYRGRLKYIENDQPKKDPKAKEKIAGLSKESTPEPKEKEGMKKCSCCKEYKPANKENFYKDKTNKDGLDTYCKPCMKEYQRKRREKKKEQG